MRLRLFQPNLAEVGALAELGNNHLVNQPNFVCHHLYCYIVREILIANMEHIKFGIYNFVHR